MQLHNFEVFVLWFTLEEMPMYFPIKAHYVTILSFDGELTVKKTVCILPQDFPLALVVGEYISLWEGILHDATLLLAANIQMITSGTLFWGCV